MNGTALKAQIGEGYQLVYAQDFESPQAIRDFEMTDPEAWKISEYENANQTLELYGNSIYEPKVRSPLNIAMIKNLSLGDFILEVDLSQSGREYGHRDLCLFFNISSPSNYYYVHIATVTDDNANNIFLVNDEPRIKISSKTTLGTDWGATNSWHKVRIERKTKEGTIKVYFDDMDEAIMEATDLHFTDGGIGFGSFDDTGRFDNIKIWASDLIKKKQGFFR